MNETDLQRLRAFYHSMLGLERTLAGIPANQPGMVVEAATYYMVADEVGEIQSAFPGLLAPFERSRFFSHDVGMGEYYYLDGLKLYVTRAVGRLKASIEDTESTPVTQVRTFKYLTDSRIRDVVARDYDEAQRAFVSKCWKSTILLCGGILEAILLDLVATHRDQASASAKAPRQPQDFERWPLSSLIDVVVDLKLVSAGVEKLSHPVREYRNLVHPGVELRTGLAFGEEEARIALEVVHIVDRDLSKA